MIDIHSHILPGVDDGAGDLSESLAMVQVAAAAGTTDIVATPHANHVFRFDPEAVDGKLEELRSAAGSGIRIHSGCELHLTADNLQDALEHPRKYAINGRRSGSGPSYVLVEFPDHSIPHSADRILEQMLDGGISPIVAHPERNFVLQRSISQVQRWAESGVLMQITAQSILGVFGRSARSAARDLIDQGLAHFVASDAHDPKHRPPSLKEAFEYVLDRHGEEIAERLFLENPGAALTGGAVQPCPAGIRRKRWFLF